jgi:hypothetical protein
MYSVAALAQTGHCDRVKAAFHELVSYCEPLGLGMYCDWGECHVGLAMASARLAREAIASLPRLLDRTDRLMATLCRATLSHALLDVGDLVAARREAEICIERGSALPVTQSIALGTLALIALHNGQPAEALTFALRGLEADARTPNPWGGSILRLARAEALCALGRTDDAHAAIREARDRIVRIAATLDDDPALRTSYLTDVVVNARTLQLADEWLGD